MKLSRLLIDLDVAPGRGLPGMVGSHTALLKYAPGFLETIQLNGAHNRGKELPGIIVGKREAVARTGIGVILLDGIGQAAYTAHYRHAAVTHGNQLTQTAGFKTRGHEEHIAAGVDSLSQFRIKSQENRHLFRITSRKRLKQLVVLLLANSQHHELHALSKQRLSDLCDQIKALRVGQARDH